MQVVASVRDKAGYGVDDLAPSDFLLTDEGAVQALAFFQPPLSQESGSSILPPATGAPARQQASSRPTTAAAAGAARTYHQLLIVVEPMRVELRQQAIRAISAFVRENRVASQFSVGLIDGPRLVQQYTSDRQATLDALTEMASARPYSPARIVALDHGLESVMKAFREFEGVPGRKSMVVFVDPDTPTTHALWPEWAIGADVALYPVDARGAVHVAPFGDAASEAHFGPQGPVIGGAGAGISMAADLMARTSAIGDQAAFLRRVAERTGGRCLVNNNDLAGIFSRIEENSRGLYVLGYYLPESQLDGRFRKVQVKVGRAGVTVRAREGYFALKR